MTGYLKLEGNLSGKRISYAYQLGSLRVLDEAKIVLDSELSYILPGARYASLFVSLTLCAEFTSWTAQKHSTTPGEWVQP